MPETLTITCACCGSETFSVPFIPGRYSFKCTQKSGTMIITIDENGHIKTRCEECIIVTTITNLETGDFKIVDTFRTFRDRILIDKVNLTELNKTYYSLSSRVVGRITKEISHELYNYYLVPISSLINEKHYKKAIDRIIDGLNYLEDILSFDDYEIALAKKLIDLLNKARMNIEEDGELFINDKRV